MTHNPILPLAASIDHALWRDAHGSYADGPAMGQTRFSLTLFDFETKTIIEYTCEATVPFEMKKRSGVLSEDDRLLLLETRDLTFVLLDDPAPCWIPAPDGSGERCGKVAGHTDEHRSGYGGEWRNVPVGAVVVGDGDE